MRYTTKNLHIKSTEQCLASSELLTPHPLSTQRVSSPHQRRGGGGTHSPGGEGVGVNISEDARHWVVLLQYNPSRRYTQKSMNDLLTYVQYSSQGLYYQFDLTPEQYPIQEQYGHILVSSCPFPEKGIFIHPTVYMYIFYNLTSR